MTTEAKYPRSGSVLSPRSMAGFHLIIYGRFWVITEVRCTVRSFVPTRDPGETESVRVRNRPHLKNSSWERSETSLNDVYSLRSLRDDGPLGSINL